jgi:putative endonuclease
VKPPRSGPRLRPAPRARREAAGWRREKGGAARRAGRGAEWAAAAWLMLKGWRILGFRLKVGGAEIDILAVRGRVLAVVEVKRRATMEAALLALTPAQYGRLVAAGRAVLRGRPSLEGHVLRIDMVALAPGRLPRHLAAVGPAGKG